MARTLLSEREEEVICARFLSPFGMEMQLPHALLHLQPHGF